MCTYSSAGVNSPAISCVYVCLSVYLNNFFVCKIETHERFKRTLSFRTDTTCKCSGKPPLSSSKNT